MAVLLLGTHSPLPQRILRGGPMDPRCGPCPARARGVPARSFGTGRARASHSGVGRRPCWSLGVPGAAMPWGQREGGSPSTKSIYPWTPGVSQRCRCPWTQCFRCPTSARSSGPGAGVRRSVPDPVKAPALEAARPGASPETRWSRRGAGHGAGAVGWVARERLRTGRPRKVATKP